MNILKKIIKRIAGIGSKKPEESIIGTVVTRLVPDKAKAKEIMLDIKKEIILHKQEMETMLLEDVQNARTLAIAELKLSLKDPRAWVRPTWAFVTLGLWIITVSQKSWAFDYWDYGIVGSIVTFYFGSRFLEKRNAKKQEQLLKENQYGKNKE